MAFERASAMIALPTGVRVMTVVQPSSAPIPTL